MSGPKFNGQISLGSLIQIALIIFAVIAGWFRIESAVGANAVEIAHILEQTSEIQQEYSSLQSRTRALENSFARADERVSIILATLARIEARLERSER